MARAVSHAIEGWMNNVEIGLCLWNRDLKALSEAFSKHASPPPIHKHI